MPGSPPFILAVLDGREGRLLRIRECATEAALHEMALEEQDHFARFPHVEIHTHSGQPREAVLAQYEAWRSRRLPARDGSARAATDSIVPQS